MHGRNPPAAADAEAAEEEEEESEINSQAPRQSGWFERELLVYRIDV